MIVTYFHLSTDELERRGYFDNLKRLVEFMYRDNGNQKVTLVVHSMGGLVSLHFLTGYSGIDQAWKDTYINAYVTLSGAWSGGVAALGSVISGKQFGDFNALNELLAQFLVPITQTIPSIPWLLPRASVFGDRVLVETLDASERDYTAADYQQLFNLIGYDNGYQIHQNLIQTITPDYPAPNVPTYCYYGVDVPTPERYIYDQVGGQPMFVVEGEGDGTVNLVSSEVCLRWRSMPYRFESRQFSGVNHFNIVRDQEVLKDIAEIVGVSQRFGSRRFTSRRFNNRRFKRAMNF